MKDYLIWEVAPMLQSYKNTVEFRERFLEKSAMLLLFLKSNNLLQSDRFEELTGTEIDFQINTSELTDTAMKLFVDGHVYKWLDANSDITRPISTKRLEYGLRKLTGVQK